MVISAEICGDKPLGLAVTGLETGNRIGAGTASVDPEAVQPRPRQLEL